MAQQSLGQPSSPQVQEASLGAVGDISVRSCKFYERILQAAKPLEGNRSTTTYLLVGITKRILERTRIARPHGLDRLECAKPNPMVRITECADKEMQRRVVADPAQGDRGLRTDSRRRVPKNDLQQWADRPHRTYFAECAANRDSQRLRPVVESRNQGPDRTAAADASKDLRRPNPRIQAVTAIDRRQERPDGLLSERG
jgi:hypothetical protein